MRNPIRILLLVGLLAPFSARAADVDAKVDAVKLDVKGDKDDIKDDKKDLKGITKLRKKWEKAVEKDKEETLAKVADDIKEWVTAEIAENRQETAESRAELVEGGGELREPTPDVKPNADGSKPAIKGEEPDSPAQADDRRDMREDRSDMRKTREIAVELHELLKKAEHGTLRGPGASDVTTLLAKLERAAERDLAHSEEELTEDEAQLDRLKSQE